VVRRETMLTVLKDETRKVYTVHSDGGSDLTEAAARKYAKRVLAEAPNAEDWFYVGCERINYDTVKVIFVEDL
jgi:hypothetical protein